jgi:uncharacterized membrane protein YdjX (TVP38/TMEM64 family)
MSQLVGALWRRLQRKLVAVAPIIVGALVLVALLSAIVYAIEPYLPATYRQLLQHAQQGDWATARAGLLALFATFGDTYGSAFVLLQVAQVVIAPIPAPLVGLLGGALFGFWHGLLLSVLGLAVGSALAMGIGRALGDVVVRRLVPSAILAKFDHLAGAGGLWSFFLIFLLPLFPDDAICFMAGLTRLPLHRLLIVCLLGRLPGIAVLTFTGSRVGADATQAYLVLGVAMALALVFWLFSEELETLLGRAAPNHT